MSLDTEAGPDVREAVHAAARRARVAARTLGTLTTVVKDRALHAAADAVLARTHQILAANAADLDAAGPCPRVVDTGFVVRRLRAA